MDDEKNHEAQDYTSDSPPNLLVGGTGALALIPVFLGSLCLVYAGVGSFVFHGGMTDFGLTLDMGSVWTLVTIIIPYLLFNHLHFVKLNYKYGPHVIILLTGSGIMYSFYFPYTSVYHSLGDATLVIPIGAALNFALLVSYYFTGMCLVKVRSEELRMQQYNSNSSSRLSLVVADQEVD